MQLDDPAIEALHGCGFEVAVETNGTRAVPNGIDWLCVSPKAEAELGTKFDVRAFHEQVLGSGALPLGVLEAKLDRWIAATKAS